jgi:nitrite reductase/ring-hydroxylating ferredoxin subunit/uncharacterized membrane protein
MRSRASFKGHPIHPSLIPFPLAFLSGAFGFDLAAILLHRASLAATAAHLAAVGVLLGVAAAIPGALDYLYTVPPRSTGKRRATIHALVNLSGVTLFALGWWIRRPAPDSPAILVVIMEALGTALLATGGWLGGTLVNRNQIGVDHRYAQAGKWQEERVDAAPGKPVVVARVSDLEVDQMKLLRVNGERIVLARTAEGYVAFQDRCTHRGGSLAGGVMICSAVQCPWHGSQFDARTGAVRSGPAKESITVYAVEVRSETVRLVM